MDKEEILTRARKKKPHQMDEMELDILLKSNHVGLLAGLAVCLIIMVIKMYYNQPYQDIYSIFCFIFCGQYLYRWIRQKDKNMLFIGVLWGISALLLFIVFLMTIR